MTNWQDAALDARHKPPEWATSLAARMGLPDNGQWHIQIPNWWRYAVDGYVFNMRKLISTEPGIFGPWATLEHVCLTCGKAHSSTGIHDQSELGAVLQAWPPICSCQKGV
jgi:hypothetical protein